MTLQVPPAALPPAGGAMMDPFGRQVTYLRVSVTDRCDFRCVYCMAENMTFLPRADLLTLEELDRLCSAFIAKGVRKLRLTGGEPLVRKNIMWLFRCAFAPSGHGALTSSRSPPMAASSRKYASELADCGVRRINVSLDTLDPAKFQAITRWGDFDKVMRGIDAARPRRAQDQDQTVALRGVNEDEIEDMLRWCHGEGMDLTLIETMPIGEIGGDRTDQYLPLSVVRARLRSASRWRTFPIAPAARRAMCSVRETGGRLGFITPLTHNFCETCNRVRVTCTGTLYMCLGQEDAADLRAPLRASASDDLAERRHRRGDRQQAQGPRLRHRPACAKARRGAPYEFNGRLTHGFECEDPDGWPGCSRCCSWGRLASALLKRALTRRRATAKNCSSTA